MVACVTRLVAGKFVLSTFPRALTTLSQHVLEGSPGLESSPGQIKMMDSRVLAQDGVPVAAMYRAQARQLAPTLPGARTP